ncbi:hypothetical protein Leef1_23 [Polaribacter phage Leef_1]|uniref:Uncharacterized protein n=1 Tax=Polaribacter phage Leef_1 TaxID=2745684 RepID=A0A8E4ZDT8_9CAUD|nr:hypothetical protein M1M28_gp23 [Polaribacter phage Leef_1]QQV91387.1 hypothetical protein Leef1_23 [Polaribacter phage Leef_1]
MTKQGEEYLTTELQRFKNAVTALKADDVNYAAHEEKRESLLKYYNERIKSYEKQLGKIKSQRSISRNVTKAECKTKHCSV